MNVLCELFCAQNFAFIHAVILYFFYHHRPHVLITPITIQWGTRNFTVSASAARATLMFKFKLVLFLLEFILDANLLFFIRSFLYPSVVLHHSSADKKLMRTRCVNEFPTRLA